MDAPVEPARSTNPGSFVNDSQEMGTRAAGVLHTRQLRTLTATTHNCTPHDPAARCHAKSTQLSPPS